MGGVWSLRRSVAYLSDSAVSQRGEGILGSWCDPSWVAWTEETRGLVCAGVGFIISIGGDYIVYVVVCMSV